MKKLPNSQIVDLSLVGSNMEVDTDNIGIYHEPGKIGTQRVAIRKGTSEKVLVLLNEGKGAILNLERDEDGVLQDQFKETNGEFKHDSDLCGDVIERLSYFTELNAHMRKHNLKMRKGVRLIFSAKGIKDKPKAIEQMMNGLKFFDAEKDYL